MRAAVDQGGRTRDARLRAAVGSLLFLVVETGVVDGLVPWGLTDWKGARPPLIVAVVGYGVLVAGRGLAARVRPVRDRGRRHAGPCRADSAPGHRWPVPLRPQPDGPRRGAAHPRP